MQTRRAVRFQDEGDMHETVFVATGDAVLRTGMTRRRGAGGGLPVSLCLTTVYGRIAPCSDRVRVDTGADRYNSFSELDLEGVGMKNNESGRPSAEVGGPREPHGRDAPGAWVSGRRGGVAVSGNSGTYW